jgi:hypothetical protein
MKQFAFEGGGKNIGDTISFKERIVKINNFCDGFEGYKEEDIKPWEQGTLLVQRKDKQGNVFGIYIFDEKGMPGAYYADKAKVAEYVEKIGLEEKKEAERKRKSLNKGGTLQQQL